MLKMAALVCTLILGWGSGAFAQTTGSAAQTYDMNKPALTNTNSLAVKKFVTTGTSAGNNSRLASDAAKTESRAKKDNRQVSTDGL